MVMSWIFTGMLCVSILASFLTGNNISGAVTQGAQAGLTLAFSIGGSMCLWTGAAKLMQTIGISEKLGRLFLPLLRRIFPSSKNNKELREALSGNITANLLGLGNAATPLGIQAAKRLVDPRSPNIATGELCRLIVLNTASIQLLPTNVAAVRATAGAASPFDILPAVWITSLLSAGLGIAMATLLERLWRHA